MYCGNCGREIKDDDKFCGNCGQKVVIENIDINNEKNNSTKSTIKISFKNSIIILLILIILFSVIIGRNLFKIQKRCFYRKYNYGQNFTRR